MTNDRIRILGTVDGFVEVQRTRLGYYKVIVQHHNQARAVTVERSGMDELIAWIGGQK